MSKKICLAMHSRNVSSDKIVRTMRTYVHPFMKAGVKFCICIGLICDDFVLA